MYTTDNHDKLTSAAGCERNNITMNINGAPKKDSNNTRSPYVILM